MRNVRSNSTLFAVVVFGMFSTAVAALATVVPLGAAADVAVLGSSTITNTGPTTVNGNVALSSGSSVTGFPPGLISNGSIHLSDAFALQAHADASAAYGQLAGATPTTDLTGIDLGGLVLTPGVYHFDTSAQLTGTLTLNAGGDPDAEFVFQIGTTLTTEAFSLMNWINGKSANVFWQVGTSATLGESSAFYGNILADQSVSLLTGADLSGRAFALNAAVTMDSNNVDYMQTIVPVPEGNAGFPIALAFGVCALVNWLRSRTA